MRKTEYFTFSNSTRKRKNCSEGGAHLLYYFSSSSANFGYFINTKLNLCTWMLMKQAFARTVRELRTLKLHYYTEGIERPLHTIQYI